MGEVWSKEDIPTGKGSGLRILRQTEHT